MKTTGNSSETGTLRQKAEALLQKKNAEKGLLPNELEELRLIHDLEVYQIELELQNEELQRALAEKKEVNDRYAELYNLAPVGFLTLSRDGKVHEINRYSSQILGREHSRLPGSRFGFFVNEEDRPVFNQFLERIFTNKTVETCEVALTGDDNSSTMVRLTGSLSLNAEQCRVILMDITQFRLAIDKLYKSEQLFRSYFDLSVIGQAITSVDKGFVEINNVVCEILGYPKAELLRLTWTELTHPDDVAADQANFNRVLSGEIEGYSMYKRFIHKDGHIVHTHLAVQCVRRPDQSADYFVAIILDISDRIQAEEKLKQRTSDLERFNRLAIGRELKMIGLKKEINELSILQGHAPPYSLDFLDGSGENNAWIPNPDK